jgi:glycosyltransferase involved in cell wall biosynthesis
MRILFLLTQDLESPAGVGRYFPWARGLVSLGHQVNIAALHANYESLGETHFVQDGVEVDYVGQMHVLKQNNLKIYYPAHKLLSLAAHATIELTRAALRVPADIIQIGKPHPMNSVAGLIAKYLRGKLVFLDCDDLEIANIHFTGNWQKWGIRYFENVMPKRVDCVSVHTFFLRDRLQKLGVDPRKIVYIPNGADFLRFADVDLTKVEKIRDELGLSGKKVIGFIGSLSSPSHPVDILFDAFQQVHNDQQQTVLLIVGGGEEYDRLVNKARSLGLDQAVIFCGRVPGVDVPLYYRLADVQVDPVIDDPVGRSRLPLKMFESWISMVPFVTQDVGDRRMVMGDPPAGLIAQAGDPNSLAKSILRIINDPDLASTLQMRGLTQAKKYSWECLTKQIEEAYQKAILTKYGNTI